MSNEVESRKVLLEVKNLKKHFPIRGSFGRKKGYIKAVDDISFVMYEGETFGLVGESGCGKSTAGRTLLRLIEPSHGESLYEGEDIFKLKDNKLQKVRRDLQMVFQDPYSSLNPKIRIGKTLEEPFKIHNIGSSSDRTERVMNLLNKLGFSKDQYYRFPHEFSGGQRQRIGLARALTTNPKLIVCDEPVSALDVSIQSQILNLLEDVQEEFGLAYLFISHDLSVVRHIADRVAVMYLGKIVETAPTDSLYESPQHPYTKALLTSIPNPNPNNKLERIRLKGEIPSPINPPSGCPFHTRCPFAMQVCKEEMPIMKEIKPNHFAACHLTDG